MTHDVVSRAEWLQASRALLAQEKAWTRERDRLSQMRRALPWVRVEKDYVFEGADGPIPLSGLFDGRSQLIVYHFMFGPDWAEGCVGCSLLCDQVDGARQHFEHKDVSWVAVSRAPIERLEAYRQRMGWRFRWVSSANNDFNRDYHVSFPETARRDGITYNFEAQPDPGIDELSGISVFVRGGDGATYHSYSSYGRGGEIVLTLYGWLDMVPRGRDETENGNLSGWVKRHDRYDRDQDRPCCAAAS